MMKSTIIKILLVVGIVLFVLAPFLGAYMAKTTLLDEKEETIKNESSDTIEDCFTQEFSLEKDQKLEIEIDIIPYENTSLTITFLRKVKYEQYLEDKEDPDNFHDADEKGFRYSSHINHRFGEETPASTGSINSLGFSGEIYYYIEFMGEQSGGDIYSIPGDYVFVLWGQNLSPDEDEAKYDIKIRIDGPGEEIGMYCLVLSLILIGVACTIGIFGFKSSMGQGTYQSRGYR